MGTRLIAYNILDGGVGRADPLAEVLLGRRPDVVGLHEAIDPAVLRRIAARLAMTFVAATHQDRTVALLTRYMILDSTNVSALLGSASPIVDATLDVNGRPLLVRVAHLIDRDDARRVGEALAGRLPHVMLVSHEPPLGLRVVDHVVAAADRVVDPAASVAPVRQLDQVLVRPDVTLVDAWTEQDRLAYYASDHLPAGAEIDFAPEPAPTEVA